MSKAKRREQANRRAAAVRSAAPRALGRGEAYASLAAGAQLAGEALLRVRDRMSELQADFSHLEHVYQTRPADIPCQWCGDEKLTVVMPSGFAQCLDMVACLRRMARG